MIVTNRNAVDLLTFIYGPTTADVVIGELRVLTDLEDQLFPSLSVPFRVDHLLLIIVTHGQLHLHFNLEEYIIKANSTFLATPGMVYRFLHKRNDCKFIFLNCSLDVLRHANINKRHIKAFVFASKSSIPIIELNKDQMFGVTSRLLELQQLNQLPKSYPYSKEIVLSLFSLLFYELGAISQLKTRSVPTKLRQKEKITMDFIDALHEHVKTKRDLEFYAGKLHISPKYLSEAVRLVMGQPARDVIKEMVIVEAKLLLSDASYSVNIIAHMLNFADQFSFSKFFKKNTGLTPSDFRSTL